jgi:hypothetical protein
MVVIPCEVAGVLRQAAPPASGLEDNLSDFTNFLCNAVIILQFTAV